MTQPLVRQDTPGRSHKRLNPEIKALRALVRAMAPLDPRARKRCLEWYVSQQAGRGITLPQFRDMWDQLA